MNFSEKSVLVLRSWATPAYKWYWRWCRWASAWRWWERRRDGWEGAARRQPGVPEEEGPALRQDTWWPREGKGRTQSGHPIAVLWGSQMWSYISQIKNLQLPVQKLIHLAPNHSISKETHQDSPGLPALPRLLCANRTASWSHPAIVPCCLQIPTELLWRI